MKKYLILIIVLIVSCTNKEKYYGEWLMTYPYSEDENAAEKIIITKDSISISSYPFVKEYSESLKLHVNELELFGEKFKTRVEDDSLLYFNNSTYIKKGYGFYNEFDTNKLSIEYPKIENIDKFKILKEAPISNQNLTNYVIFGKKINSNEFALQLNDRIAEFKELRSFLFSHSPHDYIMGISLTVDKNSKMKSLNEIFYYCRTNNVRKVKLINNIDYYLKDGDKILTSKEYIYVYLNDFVEERLIQRNDTERMLLPPPPEPSLRTIIDSNNRNIISLIKNELYFDTQKISKKELSILIEKNYKTERHFIILYDDESNYKNYLELMNIENNSINKIRNYEALRVFKKPLDSLFENDLREIKSKIPKNLINGISYNDFKKLNIKIPELALLN